MKLKLSKHWYEVRSKAEEKCMDVAAGMSLSGTAKKTAARKAKKLAAPRTASRTAASSRRREKSHFLRRIQANDADNSAETFEPLAISE